MVAMLGDDKKISLVVSPTQNMKVCKIEAFLVMQVFMFPVLDSEMNGGKGWKKGYR